MCFQLYQMNRMGILIFFNYRMVLSLDLIQQRSKKKLDESDKELLELAIIDIRQRFSSMSREIFCSFLK